MVDRSQGLIARHSGLAVAFFVIASVALPFQSNAAAVQVAGNQPTSQSHVASMDSDPLPGIMHHYP